MSPHICPSCSLDVQPNASFCSSCGSSVVTNGSHKIGNVPLAVRHETLMAKISELSGMYILDSNSGTSAVLRLRRTNIGCFLTLVSFGVLWIFNWLSEAGKEPVLFVSVDEFGKLTVRSQDGRVLP